MCGCSLVHFGESMSLTVGPSMSQKVVDKPCSAKHTRPHTHDDSLWFTALSLTQNEARLLHRRPGLPASEPWNG